MSRLKSATAVMSAAASVAPPAPPAVDTADGYSSCENDDDVDNEAATAAIRVKMRSNSNVLPSSAGLSLDEPRWRKRHGLEAGDKVG